jgi:hypothetical protein
MEVQITQKEKDSGELIAGNRLLKIAENWPLWAC